MTSSPLPRRLRVVKHKDPKDSSEYWTICFYNNEFVLDPKVSNIRSRYGWTQMPQYGRFENIQDARCFLKDLIEKNAPNKYECVKNSGGSEYKKK